MFFIKRNKKESEGGDTVNNALALCPNCHRKAHWCKTTKTNRAVS
ncbi:HNH endonuclease [Phosphitispora fastidiosa]